MTRLIHDSVYCRMCFVIVGRVDRSNKNNKQTKIGGNVKQKKNQAAERVEWQGAETSRESVLTYFSPKRTEIHF